MNEISTYLANSQPGDFKDADDFAGALYEVLESAYRTTFDAAAAQAIKGATKSAYTFYRLRDESPFGGADAPKLKFGSADKRAIRFFDSVDKWYFSKFMQNDDAAQPLRKFLREEYLEKGAALFGRETPESLDDFRKAAGGKLDNLTDFQIKRIIHGSVARIRNWAHVGSLVQGGFALARYVAIIDSRTTEICRHINGKMIRVGTAHQRINELTQLEPGDFAAEMYESNAAKAYQKNPVAWIEKRTTNDIVDDDALKQNIGLPPLHLLCRTRLEGVFEELGEAPAPVPVPAPPPAPPAPAPKLPAPKVPKAPAPKPVPVAPPAPVPVPVPVAPAPPAPASVAPPVPAPASVAPPAPVVPPEWPADPLALKVIRQLGGSTGAELVEDEFGRRFVRKRGANVAHLREEHYADEAYRALGVRVPPSKLYDGAAPVKLARFIEGQSLGSLTGTAREAAEKELRKGFAADALLGNWDVVGMSEDNVLVDQAGKVYRIDNGGALRFRAQGARKDAQQWNDHPEELWSMRDKFIGNEAGAIFEKLELHELPAQMDALKNKAKQLQAALPQELQATVKARLQAMGVYADDWRADAFKVLDRQTIDELPNAPEWQTWFKGLTKAEQSAVYDYTGPGFGPLNAWLRGLERNKPYIARIQGKLDAALAKARVQSDVVVFRGTGGDRNQSLYDRFLSGAQKLGRLHEDPGYRSTSYAESVARGGFANRKNAVVFKIKVRQGTRAAYLGDERVSGVDLEKELLLERGSKLRVDKIVRLPNGEIEVEGLLED